MGEIKRKFVYHFSCKKQKRYMYETHPGFKNKRKIRLFNFSSFIFSFKELNFFLSLFSQLKARKLRQRVTQTETETGIHEVETGIDLLEIFDFFGFNTNLTEMAVLASNDFTAAKKVASSGVQPNDHWSKSLMLILLG